MCYGSKPEREIAKLRRSTVQRATPIPSRFSCFQILCGPSTRRFPGQTRSIAARTIAFRFACDGNRAGSRRRPRCSWNVDPATPGCRGSARSHTDPDSPRQSPPSLPSVVEFRLDEIRRRPPQNLVRASQLTILPLQRLQPLPVHGRQGCTLARVAFGLAHPTPWRLSRAADLRCDRRHCRPLRCVLAPMLQHHPDGRLAYLG